jgi:hypothetical protein
MRTTSSQSTWVVPQAVRSNILQWIVSTLLGYVYFRDATNQGKLPSSYDEALKIGTSVGAITGQLLFGILCDKLGRKKVYLTSQDPFLIVDVRSVSHDHDFHDVIHRPHGLRACNFGNRHHHFLARAPRYRYRWGLSYVCRHYLRIRINEVSWKNDGRSLLNARRTHLELNPKIIIVRNHYCCISLLFYNSRFSACHNFRKRCNSHPHRLRCSECRLAGD